jgi:hypothetical protein
MCLLLNKRGQLLLSHVGARPRSVLSVAIAPDEQPSAREL